MTSYTSPHWPLQVSDEHQDLYAAQYDQGYDRLREERLESLKAANIIGNDHVLPPRNDAIKPWNELSVDEKRKESRKMELYSSMVENLDFHVGRLLDYLKSNDLYDNTLVVFMSDNGAAAEDFYYSGSYADYISTNYSDDYADMGKPGSWISYGPQWAEAGSAPFPRHKNRASEGGIVAPMIVAGAGLNMPTPINREYITVMDLAPTFLELADATYPVNPAIEPMRGESMVPLLSGIASSVHDESFVTTLFLGGRAFIRQGNWKLMNLEPPFSETEFMLFSLEADPAETTSLRDAMPEKYNEMLALWRKERIALGIILPQDL